MRLVGHQMADRVFRLKGDAQLRQSPGHALNVVEAYADSGASELDHVADFADLDAIRYVVGLDFLGTASLDAG